MPTKIKIRKGQRLVLIAKKKRGKQVSAAPGEIVRKRKGVILPPDAESVYRPRRRAETVLEFYDLGRLASGATWNFEFVYSLNYNGGIVERGSPAAEFERFKAELLARFASPGGIYQIPYQKSWLYLTDLVFYRGTEKRFVAIAENGQRTYLPDEAFTPPPGQTTTPEWTESGAGRACISQSYRHLRVNNLLFFAQFDTGNTDFYKITSEPVWTATQRELSFKNAGLCKIYLVPRLADENLFQEFRYPGPFGIEQGFIRGRYIQVLFPREYLAQHELFNPFLIDAAQDFVAYGTASQATAINPQQSAMRSVVAAAVNNRQTNRCLYLWPPAAFSQWDSLIIGTAAAKRVSYAALGSQNFSLVPGVTPPLVGVVEKGTQKFYIWAIDPARHLRQVNSYPDGFFPAVPIGSNVADFAADGAANDDWRLS